MHLFLIILAALFAFHFLVLTREGQSIMRFAEKALLIIVCAAAVLIFLFVSFVLVYNFPYFFIVLGMATALIIGWVQLDKRFKRRLDEKKLLRLCPTAQGGGYAAFKRYEECQHKNSPNPT